jgi:hypothetical protein
VPLTAQVKALFERVGEFDHLITSSGRGADVPLLEATFDQLQEPWRVKYWSQLLAVKYGEQSTTINSTRPSSPFFHTPEITKVATTEWGGFV